MPVRRSPAYTAAPAPNGPTVHLYIASFNTALVTELCVRSAREYAGYPFELTVGDSGSTDGSIHVLERLQQRGWLVLERRAATQHAEWIDGWRKSASADLLVFADSDVEFRRRGWLAEMVREQGRTVAALVAAEMLPESRGSFNPVAQTQVRGMVRAAPWLVMLDRRQTAAVTTSFLYDEFASDEVSEGRIAYDVGARFFESLVERGLLVHEMPRRHRRRWHHYAGMSWVPLDGLRGRKKQRDLRVACARLGRLAGLQDRGRLRDRTVVALASAPEMAEVGDALARVRLKLRAIAPGSR